MSFTFCCSLCGQTLAVDTRYVGTQVRCPACRGVTVPPAQIAGVLPAASTPTPVTSPASTPALPTPAPRRRARWYASGTGLAIAAAVAVFLLLPASVLLIKQVFKGSDMPDPLDTKMALLDGQGNPGNKLGVPIDLETGTQGPRKGLVPGEIDLERKKQIENKLGQPTQPPPPPRAVEVRPEPRKAPPAGRPAKIIVPANNVIVPPAVAEPVKPAAAPAPQPKPAAPAETPAQVALREKRTLEQRERRREEIFALDLKLADRAMERRDFARALKLYEEAAKIKRTQEVMTGLFVAKMEHDQARADEAQKRMRDEARRRQDETEERATRLARLREEAQQALANNNPRRATEALKEALKLVPDDVVLMQGLTRAEKLAEKEQQRFVAEGLTLKQRREKDLADQVAAADRVVEQQRRNAQRQKEDADRNYQEIAAKAQQAGKAATAEAEKRIADQVREAERARQDADQKLAALKEADRTARADQAVRDKQLAAMVAKAAQENQEAEQRLAQLRAKSERSARAAETAAQKRYADMLAAAERQRQESDQQLVKARAQAAQASGTPDGQRLAELAAAERQRKEAEKRYALLKEKADQTARAEAEEERQRFAATLAGAEWERKAAQEQQRQMQAQAEQTAKAAAEADQKRYAETVRAAERQRKEAEEQQKHLREQAAHLAKAAAEAEQKRYTELLRTAERQKQEAEEHFQRVTEQARPTAASEASRSKAVADANVAAISPAKTTPAPAKAADPAPQARPGPSAAELAARKAQEEADVKKLSQLHAEEARATAEQKQREEAAAQRKRQEEQDRALGQKLLEPQEPAAAPKGASAPGNQKSSQLRHEGVELWRAERRKLPGYSPDDITRSLTPLGSPIVLTAAAPPTSGKARELT